MAFEPSDVRRLADLLIPPPRRDVSWDKAQPGIALAQRLLSVSAEAPPSIDEMLDSGRDDIGMEADESDQLPAAPNEPSDGTLASLGRAAMKRIAEGFAKLLGSKSPPKADRAAGGKSSSGSAASEGQSAESKGTRIGR